MSELRSWEDHMAMRTPEERRAIEELMEQDRAEMPKHHLRFLRALTKRKLEVELGASAPEVAEMEQHADTFLRTLRTFLDAAGGQLKLIAMLPHDGDFVIDSFEQIGPYGGGPIPDYRLDPEHYRPPDEDAAEGEEQAVDPEREREPVSHDGELVDGELADRTPVAAAGA